MGGTVEKNCTIFLFLFLSATTCQSENWQSFKVSKWLLEIVEKIIPPGKIILELHSNSVNQKIYENYNVYSVEYDLYWLNKYNAQYIYAPLKNNWFDIDIMIKELPTYYDLLIVNGPIGDKMIGFYKHLHLFNQNVPIIFSNILRPLDFETFINVSKTLNRSTELIAKDTVRLIGIINKKKLI